MNPKVNFFCFLSFLFIGCKQSKYPTDKIKEFIPYYLVENSKAYTDSAKEFIYGFEKGYKKPFQSFNVRKIFYDSFFLISKEKIVIDYYFSNSRESLFYFYPSTENQLKIFGTEFPIQYRIIYRPDYRIHDLVNESGAATQESFLRAYDTTQGPIAIGQNSFMILRDISVGVKGKIVTFLEPNSYIFLKSFEIEGADIYNKYFRRKLFYNGIGILFSDNKLKNHNKLGEFLGEQLATHDIMSYYINSLYFRECLAIDSLSSYAKKILIEYEKSKLNDIGKSNLPEFTNETRILNQKLKEFNIELAAKDIFEYEKSRLSTGKLIWFYKSKFEFSLQWLFINTFVIIGFILLKKVKQLKNFISIWQNDQVAFWTVNVSINAWILNNKLPENLDFLYFYPLLIPILYLYVFLRNKKNTIKSSPE